MSSEPQGRPRNRWAPHTQHPGGGDELGTHTTAGFTPTGGAHTGEKGVEPGSEPRHRAPEAELLATVPRCLTDTLAVSYQS